MKAILLIAVLFASACTPRENDAQKQIRQNKLDAIEMERREDAARKMLENENSL